MTAKLAARVRTDGIRLPESVIAVHAARGRTDGILPRMDLDQPECDDRKAPTARGHTDGTRQTSTTIRVGEHRHS